MLKSHTVHKNKCLLLLQDMEYGEVMDVRKTMINNLYTVAIDEVKITTNTSLIPDKQLSNSLGMIPLLCSDYMPYQNASSRLGLLQPVSFELNIHNTTKKISRHYSGDLVEKSGSSDIKIAISDILLGILLDILSSY